MELREGKDRPKYLPPKVHSDLGKTVVLVLRLCHSLGHTGSIVVMNSVFCVVKAIVELRKRGIFSSSMIKKKRLWPKYVKGDEILSLSKIKNQVMLILLNVRGEREIFYIHGLQESDYSLLFMTTYGTLDRCDKEQKRKIITKEKKTNQSNSHTQRYQCNTMQIAIQLTIIIVEECSQSQLKSK